MLGVDFSLLRVCSFFFSSLRLRVLASSRLIFALPFFAAFGFAQAPQPQVFSPYFLNYFNFLHFFNSSANLLIGTLAHWHIVFPLCVFPSLRLLFFLSLFFN